MPTGLPGGHGHEEELVFRRPCSLRLEFALERCSSFTSSVFMRLARPHSYKNGPSLRRSWPPGGPPSSKKLKYISYLWHREIDRQVWAQSRE